MIQVNEANYDAEVVQHGDLVVMDFYADWCGPCRMQVPALQAVQNEAKIVKINTDDNAKLATDYKIMSIPTLVFVKNGTEVGRMVGAQNEAALRNKIQELK